MTTQALRPPGSSRRGSLPSGRRHARVLRLRRPTLSLRYRPRVAAGVLLAAVAVVVVAGWSLTLGDLRVPLREVLATAVGLGSGEHDFVVRTLRLPRTLTAVGVGVALACSGALFQAVVRNPLAAPDIVGIVAGASFVAVVLIVVRQSPAAAPVGALLGALAAAALVYALTWRSGVSGQRLVLVGIGVNAVLAALTTLVLVRFPAEQVAPAVLWTTGTLHVRTWDHVIWLGVGLALLLPAALALLPPLRALQLGDDTARALGARPEGSRLLVVAVAASLAAAGVAAAGPVGFVALVVPHAARLLLGPLTGGTLVVTGLLGALLVLLADIVAQHAFSPTSLPVGVVTAAIGAPAFLVLFHRAYRGGE